MASRPTRQMNRNNSYVRGNLAYDYDYLERERQRREERERQARRERYEREERPQRRAEPRKRQAAAPRHRERVYVSPLAVLGFAAVAVMLVAVLGSYAELTAVSLDVTTMQNELDTLENEHVTLIGRYERTFDLSAIKAAAEAAGMAKPSASQVYYIDLSAPDSVVLYPQEETNVLGRAFSTIGQSAVSLVEYFK